MSEAKAISAISNNTIIVHGRKMEANTLLNIPNIARSHGMRDLMEKFTGLPAVIAGAGPSLDAALPALKANYGKYLLIAVDRSLKPLILAGVVPHIVCTSDMDAVLLSLFRGYEIPDSVALLYDRDCFNEVPRTWKGPLITYDHYYDVGIWQSTFFGHRGFLCKNFTVSHTAMYAAAAMGCNPVILTGVDFAYPSKIDHHAKGAVEVGQEALEMAAYHWLDIPGNVLPTVRTTEVFSICAPAFAHALKEAGIECWNTSTIGAKIGGAEFKRIDEALTQYGKPDDYGKRLRDCLTDPTFDLHAFGMQSRFVIQAMDTLLEDATEAIDIMVRAKRTGWADNKLMFEKGRKLFVKGVEKMNKILADTFCQYLLQRVMLAACDTSRKIKERAQHLKDLHPDKIKADCHRNTIMFWQFGENAKLFIQCLQKARMELGLDPVETKWIPEKVAVTA